MAMKGVTTFSAYIQYLMVQIMDESAILTKYPQVFTKISVDKERIIIQDHKLNRIIELKRKDIGLECQHCNRDNCIHVGFCWSFPEIYPVNHS